MHVMVDCEALSLVNDSIHISMPYCPLVHVPPILSRYGAGDGDGVGSGAGVGSIVGSCVGTSGDVGEVALRFAIRMGPIWLSRKWSLWSRSMPVPLLVSLCSFAAWCTGAHASCQLVAPTLCPLTLV